MAKKFQGFGGGANMQQMIRQAQKMQQEMARVSEELENLEVSASAGGGMVTATVSGKKELKALKINPEAVDPDDVEMLQDLVIAAVNEAMRQVDEKSQQEMGKVTGGMNLPGMF